MVVAIYNTWDHELLRKSVDNIKKCVDEVIIVYSQKSNYGQVIEFPISDYQDCYLFNHEPDLSKQPFINETAKRNSGLNEAKRFGADYFVMMDSDEFYNPELFKYWLNYLQNSDLKGLVCRSQVYFKHPTLSVEDKTLITFIHKLDRSLKFCRNPKYPFAYENGIPRIDPTRQLNINNGIKLIEFYCDHYSWVRDDFSRKINNSTARNNLKKSTILEDLQNARVDYFCKFYGQKLKAVNDKYGLVKCIGEWLNDCPYPECNCAKKYL